MQTMALIQRRLRDLPILNTEAYRLVDYCSKPEPEFDVIEEIVQGNPNLCSQIMRLANSSFFKRSERTETLQEALVLLGLTTLRQIFVQNFYNSIGNLMNTQARLLNHGRACSHLAEFLAKAAGQSALDLAKIRIGALLHDIGQQFLSFFFPKQYDMVQSASASKGIPIFRLEQKAFEVSHQEVGAVLSAKWNFPDYLTEIIGKHHDEGLSPRSLVMPVFCANSFLHEAAGEPSQPYLDPLKAYFSAYQKKLPWSDPKAALEGALKSVPTD